MQKTKASLMLMILLMGCRPELKPIEICLETFADAGNPFVCRCFQYEANINNVGVVGEPYDVPIELCTSEVRMSAGDFIDLNTFHERVREEIINEM